MGMLMVSLSVGAAWMRRMARQRGQGMVEYGVLAAFLVLVVAGAVIFLGPKMAAWLQAKVCEIMGSGACQA